ncbi:class I SAM-dependent DNA methyltransferase [Nonomuraea zeae]|uniref:Class I SAM-dependent methyltransferase n=1 Tax=Nonomuraea zeae TaxID=1642303 RepID=A0A5S4GY97_9ACTN|nr:methyltransferase domain-containing protein [Nonomuraea zeae]TMR37779.1 class I SAM-dependent methyltransferase [Nonomuraea zeae]
MTEPDFLRSTRASYDAVAAEYAKIFHHELAGKPLDRAMFAAFAELVRAGGGPVADIGSGPGRVTEHLHGLGLEVFGVDLSPEMVALARRTHPGLRFEVGSMLALDLPDGGLGGLVANYSIIHLPEDRLPGAFAEFHRVLAPGGHLLVAFQVGDERKHLTERFGRRIDLEFHRRRPDHVADLLVKAGFAMTAQLVREPMEGSTEPTQQACLLARRPA